MLLSNILVMVAVSVTAEMPQGCYQMDAGWFILLAYQRVRFSEMIKVVESVFIGFIMSPGKWVGIQESFSMLEVCGGL